MAATERASDDGRVRCEWCGNPDVPQRQAVTLRPLERHTVLMCGECWKWGSHPFGEDDRA